MKTHRIILIMLTCVVCLLRFDYFYRDSIQYLWYVEYFSGLDISLIANATVLDEFVVRAPFVYRPLVPFIVSLISGGTNVSLVFSLFNMGILCVLTECVYRVCSRLTENNNMVFLGTLITVVSYPLAFYGANTLVDAAAMLVFVGIIAFTEFGYKDRYIVLLLFIGVFIKEIVLILGLYYVLRRGWRRVWVLIPAGIGYIGIRLFFGLQNSLIYNLNILERPIQILGIFGITLILPLVIIIIQYLRGFLNTEQGKKIFIVGLLVNLPLIFLGLFFVYFDGRFLWSLLIILGIYISTMRK